MNVREKWKFTIPSQSEYSYIPRVLPWGNKSIYISPTIMQLHVMNNSDVSIIYIFKLSINQNQKWHQGLFSICYPNFNILRTYEINFQDTESNAFPKIQEVAIVSTTEMHYIKQHPDFFYLYKNKSLSKLPLLVFGNIF